MRSAVLSTANADDDMVLLLDQILANETRKTRSADQMRSGADRPKGEYCKYEKKIP